MRKKQSGGGRARAEAASMTYYVLDTLEAISNMCQQVRGELKRSARAAGIIKSRRRSSSG